MKRLVLTVDGLPIEFTFAQALGAFPYLLEVQNLRESARAGHLNNFGTGEAPSLVVVLHKEAIAMVGRPLRARADVYEGSEFYFGGYVASLVYGRELTVTLEA